MLLVRFVSTVIFVGLVAAQVEVTDASNLGGEDDQALTCSSTTLTTAAAPMLGYEQPPESFDVRLNYKAGGRSMMRDPILIAMVHCVGVMAKRSWDNILASTFHCRQKSELDLDIRPAIAQNAVLNKHAIWSMQRLFDWWIIDQSAEFRDTNFLTMLDGAPLSFGSAVWTNRLGEPEGTRTAENITELSRRQEDQDTSTSSTLNSTSDLSVGRIGLRVAFLYPPGPLVNPIGFYSLIFDAIIKLAEYDYDHPIRCERLYERVLNVTLEFGATSEAAAAEGTFRRNMAIQALIALADFMIEQPAIDKFSTFSARIRRDGAYIGRLNFYKGSVYPFRRDEAAREPGTDSRRVTARRSKVRGIARDQALRTVR